MKKKHNYLGKGIERPYDLAPRGIRSTEQSQKVSFNDTFTHIWKQL